MVFQDGVDVVKSRIACSLSSRFSPAMRRTFISLRPRCPFASDTEHGKRPGLLAVRPLRHINKT